jgi:hypothetical protein
MTKAHWAKELSAKLRVISVLSAMVLTVYGCSRSPSSYDLASMFDQAQKATPAPDPAGYFRAIKSLDLAGLSRNAIFQHPPSTITYSMKVPKGHPLFRSSLGLTPNSWDKAGDGVEFLVAIEARGVRRELFRRYIDPKADPALRRWNDIEVDLSPYAGEDVKFSLITGAGPKGDAQYDWAVWGDPRIQPS